MTTPEQHQEAGTGESGADGDPDIEEIQASIEQTREELGETVDALTAKLDVKSRTKARLSDTKNQAAVKLQDARAKASDLTRSAQKSVTDDHGKPKPALIAGTGALAAVVVTTIAVVAWRKRRPVPVVAWRRRGRPVPVLAGRMRR